MWYYLFLELVSLWLLTRGGILGHQFDQKRESFAPCYSQPFYRWISIKNQTL
jgi:hypothetical protein